MSKHFAIFAVLFLLLLLNISLAPVAAQSSAANETDKIYLFGVKNINEFIERFNNDPTTLINREMRQFNNSGFRRIDLLTSLFNNPKSWAGNSLAYSFLAQVLDTCNVTHLSFPDSSIFAEANATIKVNGTMIVIPVLMQLQSFAPGIFRWCIVDFNYKIGNNDRQNSKLKYSDSLKLSGYPYFLSALDYVTNFLDFDVISGASNPPENYVDSALLTTAKGTALRNQLFSGKLQFLFAAITSFRLGGVKNYIIIVQKFERADNNNGWLISNIKYTAEDEKKVLMSHLTIK